MQESVLVVDHDSVMRQAIASVLVTAGYRAAQAASELDALAILGDGQPIDMAVVDFVLEGSSCIRLCEAIRRRDSGADLPILVISSASDSASHRAAVDAGADDFLTKPVHRGELLLRVRSLLQFQRMRHELAASNELLRQQRDAILRVQRQKEELMEVIVHDLKNPLAAIAANADFLAMAQEMNDDVRDGSHAIGSAAADMLRMVHNLLDVSRAEDATLTLTLSPVDLSELVRRTCALMSRRARERRVELRVVVEAEGLTSHADADLLRRMLENLIDNAVRYTAAGGAVTVACREQGSELELSVADEGPGVPPEQRERIFEKYAQLDRKIDREQRRFGRGIGLAFVKLAATAHGARVWVEDSVPCGSRFVLRRPRKQPIA